MDQPRHSVAWFDSKWKWKSVMSNSLQLHGLDSLRNFPGQNTGVGSQPFPPPGDLPNPAIKPRSSPLQAGFFTSWATREALIWQEQILKKKQTTTTSCSNFPKGSVLVVWRLKMFYRPSPKYLFYRQRNWRSKRWSQRTQTSKWKALD